MFLKSCIVLVNNQNTFTKFTYSQLLNPLFTHIQNTIKTSSQPYNKIRKVYLMQHPLCEECLSKGIINAGTLEQPLSIHHLKSPFQNGEINWALLTDIENLRTLCPKCHQEEHLKQKYGDSRTPEKIIEDLERLLNGEGNMEGN